MVQGNGAGPTTILTGIASTLHHAIAHVPWHGGGICWNRVGAVTFPAIFGAGDREAFAGAEIHTSLDGHGIGASASAGEFAVVDAVRAAASI